MPPYATGQTRTYRKSKSKTQKRRAPLKSRMKTYKKRVGFSKKYAKKSNLEVMIKGEEVTDLSGIAVFAGNTTYKTEIDCSVPVSASPFGAQLNLWDISQGTTHNTRIGDYITSKNLLLNLQIVMDAPSVLTANDAPIQFKVVVFRNRRVNAQLGTFKEASKALFISPQGEEVGYSGPLGPLSLNQLYNARFNKRNFIIYADRNFKLSPNNQVQVDSAVTARLQTGKQYPSLRNLKFSIGINKKIHFITGTNSVDSYDTHYRVLVLAFPTIAGQPRCDYYSVNCLASHFYVDT